MPIGDIKGYCILKSKDNFVSVDFKSFKLGHPYRIMDIAVDKSGFLILNAEATAIAQVEMSDIGAWFECDSYGDVLCKPGLNMVEKMHYHMQCLNRKGGYNQIIRSMVIAASLHRGEFCDSVLWQCQ